MLIFSDPKIKPHFLNSVTIQTAVAKPKKKRGIELAMHEKTGLRCFRLGPTQTGVVQLQTLAKRLEGLYYLCNENKSAVQLRGLFDLAYAKRWVFPQRGLY